MRICLSGLALLFMVACGTVSKGPETQRIQVRSNRNIELFGLLMQLDLAPDALGNNDLVKLDGRVGKWREWYEPTVRNYERYKGFADGAMMKAYRELLGRGFYNDFLIEFLLQSEEAPRARLREDADDSVVRGFSKTGDLVEGRKNASEFLEKLNEFYREIRFDEFLKENEGKYARVRELVVANLPAPGFVGEMERFYGKKFKSYALVPSLNIPTGMGFGKMHRRADAIYNVFGPFTFSDPPDFGFGKSEKILNLSLHEFGHSFVNPAVDQVPKDVLTATEGLFEPIKEQLSKQGYGMWTIALYEHFVRAGEVLIARRLGNENGAAENLRRNVEEGFIYLPRIVNALERFDSRRTSYEAVVAETVSGLRE